MLVAEVHVRQAENQLAQLQQGLPDGQVAQARQAVRIAQAQLALAQEPVTAEDIAGAKAQVDASQAALDALASGPRPEQLDAALAQIAVAEGQVRAAEAMLDTLVVTAPFCRNDHQPTRVSRAVGGRRKRRGGAG